MSEQEELFSELKRFPFDSIAATRIKSLERNGFEWRGICPWHKDHDPSFTIFKNSEGVYLYKCLACGVNGNAIQFVSRFDKVPILEAVKRVKKELEWFEGKKVVESSFRAPLAKDQKHETFPVSMMDGLTEALKTSPIAKKWLDGRGILLETAIALRWGFLPSLEAISPNHPWVDKGWIVMPTIQDDIIMALKYRSVMGKKSEDGKIAGIRRKPDMVTCLYNLRDIEALDDAFLVEGEPDTAIMKQAGYNTASLPMATYTIEPTERDTLIHANRLFLAGDMDSEGKTAMLKLWGELRDRVYMIDWPNGCKDANDAFIKHCDGDQLKFQELVESLKSRALEKPIPDFYDVSRTLRNTDFTNPLENPRRLRMRDPNVDKMAITLPGNVVSVFATYTGTGKTTWCLDQFELDAVMKYGAVVVNYSAELSPDEFGYLVAANILQKHRLELTKEDFEETARRLEKVNAKFYVGYNPDFNRIGLVLDSLEWSIRRLGAHIVVLDHLHFICRGEKDEIKAQADAMQRIKNMARKYNVIFVVIGQSRKEQPNKKGRPSEASDAKGSESFISDATTTYHIHRSLKRDVDLDNPNTWPDDLLDPLTDIRLYKCRTKGPGKAVARQVFQGAFGRFYPHTVQEQNPGLDTAVEKRKHSKLIQSATSNME